MLGVFGIVMGVGCCMLSGRHLFTVFWTVCAQRVGVAVLSGVVVGQFASAVLFICCDDCAMQFVGAIMLSPVYAYSWFRFFS